MSAKIIKAKKRYLLGYCGSQTAMMQQRTLETHEQFLLPYLKPGINVLDYGCGPGTMISGIAKAIFPGKVIGIDVSEEQLERARLAAKKAKITNLEYQIADVYDLPFAKNSFDLVFSQCLLDHLRDPLKAIAADDCCCCILIC